MTKRIYNEASPNTFTHIEGRVEDKKNTIPFDMELITLLNFITEEELVEHLNNILKNKIQIVKGDR